MDYPPEKGSRLILLNIAIGLGTFIQVLDTSIANVALPYIAGSLSASAQEGTWVITSFAASNAIVLPLTGWLSDYFGRVRLFVFSILFFALASFLCGLSTSLFALITLRVFQGAVAGALIPLSQSLLMANNPPEKQGAALGFWATIVVVAPILGPIIGGYLTEEYAWPWIFYINVPIGVFSAFITWMLLKGRESSIVRNPIDWTGLFLLSLGVACVQIMLDKGRDLDWFSSNVIIGLAITSTISLIYFAIWSYFQRYPIVDFSFFKNRNFSCGCLCITLGFLIYFGSTVTLPLWLQTQQNYTAYWAGIAVAPIGIAPFLFSTFIGAHLYWMDLRIWAVLSFLVFAIGFYYQSTFTIQVSLSQIMVARFLQGFGILTFFLPILQLSLGAIPKNRYASASGLFHFIRILVGSGFGTSLSVELWNHLEIYHHARLTEPLTLYSPVTQQLYSRLNQYALFPREVVDRLLDKQLEQQAFTLSTNDMSWLGIWLFVAMIPLIFLCKPVKAAHSAEATH